MSPSNLVGKDRRRKHFYCRTLVRILFDAYIIKWNKTFPKEFNFLSIRRSINYQYFD